MIYLNNSATSYPKPANVLNKITEIINNPPFDNLRGGLSLHSVDFVSECRKNLAKLFNIKNYNRIILNSGSTESLNTIIFGLDLNGCHVITTATEHNSVLRPLFHLKEKNIIELTIIPCDENGYVYAKDIESAIKENTKLIIVNHVSNVTGSVQNIKEISTIAHKNNILICIDASQSAGSEEINVEDDEIDILVFTGHKSLFGLQGIGGFYLKEFIELHPLKVGGTGIKSNILTQPKEMPTYYEAGTQNMTGIASLNEGVKFIFKTDIEKIKQKKTLLIDKLYQSINLLPNIIIYSKQALNNGSTILTFNIKSVDSEDTNYILENSFDIITRAGLHCAPLIHKYIKTPSYGNVRISPSYFTTDEEIDILTDAIIQITKGCL